MAVWLRPFFGYDLHVFRLGASAFEAGLARDVTKALG